MKKLLCLLTLLLALMGLLAFELLADGPDESTDTVTELAEHAPPRAPRQAPPANMTELQRVIRQGTE